MYMPYGKMQVNVLAASGGCIKSSGFDQPVQKPTRTKATSAQQLAKGSHEGKFCVGIGALGAPGLPEPLAS